MVVCADRLAFVHLPKTGGAWITEQLRVYLGGSFVCRGHTPASVALRERPDGMFDPESRPKLTFGILRDPWSWYASWYHHAMSCGEAYREGLSVYGGGSLAFRDVLYGVTHADPDRAPGTTGAPGTAAGPGVFFHGFDASLTDRLRGDLMGLMSWCVRNQYRQTRAGRVDRASMVPRSGFLVDLFLDTATLRQGFAELCSRVGTEVGPDIHDPDKVPAINTAQGRAGISYTAPEMYDAQMLDWVAVADADLIDTFRFAPFAPSTLGPIIDVDNAARH